MANITGLLGLTKEKLNKRILIRKRKDYPTGDFEIDSEMTIDRRRWARIQPVGTSVYAEGIQTDHNITHRIVLKKISGITTSHEIVCGNHVYRVLRNADVDGGNDYTLIEVEQLQ